MNTKIQLLDWDSKFFKMNIGRLDLDGGFTISEILACIQSKQLNLVYAMTSKRLTMEQADKLNAKLVDGKISLELNTNNFTMDGIETDDAVRLYDGEPQKLYLLAFQAGHKSRYKIDKNFAEGEFERFYRTWVENSINKQIADYVIVYQKAGSDDIVGFMTLKIKEKVAHIGLFAVDSESRGHKIGTKLIKKAVELTREAGLQLLCVPTQEENHGSRQFYRTMGFKEIACTYIYHIWAK